MDGETTDFIHAVATPTKITPAITAARIQGLRAVDEGRGGKTNCPGLIGFRLSMLASYPVGCSYQSRSDSACVDIIARGGCDRWLSVSQTFEHDFIQSIEVFKCGPSHTRGSLCEFRYVFGGVLRPSGLSMIE